MNWSIVLASACGIAVAQGFFLGGLLIAKDKRQFGAYFFWGLTIVAVSIRISKSLVYYFLPDMSLWGVAIGGAGLWAIGPALLFSLQEQSGKPNGLKNYWHFLPGVLLLFSGAFLGWSEMKIVYGLGTIQLLTYPYVFFK